MKCKMINWEKAHQLSEKLYEEIKKEKYRPDAIVTPARGGFHPAREVCDFLRVKKLFSLSVSHWGLAKKEGEARIEGGIETTVEDEKVLVIDDISDTGESLKVTVDYLEKMNPAQVKTGVLHVRDGSGFAPDFHAEKLETDAWIIYPWMKHEDLSQFIEEILAEKEMKLQQIQSQLRKDYSLKIKQEEIKKILEDLEYWEEIKKKEDKYSLVE